MTIISAANEFSDGLLEPGTMDAQRVFLWAESVGGRWGQIGECVLVLKLAVHPSQA